LLKLATKDTREEIKCLHSQIQSLENNIQQLNIELASEKHGIHMKMEVATAILQAENNNLIETIEKLKLQHSAQIEDFKKATEIIKVVLKSQMEENRAIKTNFDNLKGDKTKISSEKATNLVTSYEKLFETLHDWNQKSDEWILKKWSIINPNYDQGVFPSATLNRNILTIPSTLNIVITPQLLVTI